MQYKVSFGVLLIFSYFFACDSIGISGKLDFDDDHPSIIRNRDNVHKFPGTANYKTIKTYEKTSGDDLDNIGVVCVSGGCNTTKSSSQAGVETDVVVHVKTKVDLNKSNVDDTPDVPVVVGSSGKQDDYDGSLNVQPLVVSNLDDRVYTTSTYRPYTTSTSTYNPFDNRRTFIENANPFSTYGPSTSVYGISTESSLPFNPSFSYGISNEPRVDITLKSLPNDINRSLVKDYNTASRTYYHTDPTPSSWYPSHKPSINHHRYHNNWDATYHRHSTNGLDTCICKNGQPGTIVNNQWYADNNNNPNRRVGLDDPGSQINDKLAPLN